MAEMMPETDGMILELMTVDERPFSISLHKDILQLDLSTMLQAAFTPANQAGAAGGLIPKLATPLLATIGRPVDLRNTSIHYDGDQVEVEFQHYTFGLPVQHVRIAGVPVTSIETVYEFLRRYDLQRAARFSEQGEQFKLPLAAVIAGFIVMVATIYLVTRRSR